MIAGWSWETLSKQNIKRQKIKGSKLDQSRKSSIKPTRNKRQRRNSYQRNNKDLLRHTHTGKRMERASPLFSHCWSYWKPCLNRLKKTGREHPGSCYLSSTEWISWKGSQILYIWQHQEVMKMTQKRMINFRQNVVQKKKENFCPVLPWLNGIKSFQWIDLQWIWMKSML